MSDIDKDGIDSDGIVEDLDVETYYAPLDSLIEADDYLRVIADNGFTDVETRIPYSALEEMGWKRAASHPGADGGQGE
jgi:hypothetical protein